MNLLYRVNVENVSHYLALTIAGAQQDGLGSTVKQVRTSSIIYNI